MEVDDINVSNATKHTFYNLYWNPRNVINGKYVNFFVAIYFTGIFHEIILFFSGS
jgi:hypothetical protein